MVGPIGMMRVKMETVQRRLLSEFYHLFFQIVGINWNSLPFSQNSTATDDWAGFESYNPATAKTNATTATKETRRATSKPAKATTDDFGTLDVKSSKGSVQAGATKKPEDDAWDLLNN